MNVLVQLGIGVLAAGLVMGVMFCRKNMRRLVRFIYAGLVTAAGIALLVCGLTAKQPAAEAVASPLTKEEQVEFAYAFLVQGEYEIAEELMTEYANMYGYDDACIILDVLTQHAAEGVVGAGSTAGTHGHLAAAGAAAGSQGQHQSQTQYDRKHFLHFLFLLDCLEQVSKMDYVRIIHLRLQFGKEKIAQCTGKDLLTGSKSENMG